MSTSTVSTPCSLPAFTASNATDAGSAPSFSERTVFTPTRSPQVVSCSEAAARNVSAAPRIRDWPSATITRAILPTVVVLPTPFTPTTSTTPGLPSLPAVFSSRSMSGRTIFTSSSRSIFFTAAGLLVPSTRTRCCSASTRRVVGSEPRSASSRVSSTSSQTSWSMRSRESRASRPLPSMLFERARRARRRTRRPADGSGISSSIARGAELSGSSTEPPEALAAS